MSWNTDQENQKDREALRGSIMNAQSVMVHLRNQIQNLEASHAALQDQLLLIQGALSKIVDKVEELENRLGGEG